MATTRQSLVNDGQIAIVQLNRPHVKNAFNDSVYEELVQFLTECQQNPLVQIAVLSGCGDFFSSGADLNQLSDTTPSLGKPKLLMQTMISFPKLLIAAVNGPAIGIGVTLLLHCDFVYATTNATFWTPFLRLGIAPEFASSITFPQTMGRAMANDLLIRQRRICAQTALTAGIISEIFPNDGQFLEKIIKIAKGMVQQPLADKSLPLFKKMIDPSRKQRLLNAVEEEYKQIDRRFENGETMEAVLELIKERSSAKQRSKL